MGKVKSNYIGTIIESTIGTTTKTLSIGRDLLKIDFMCSNVY